MYKAVYEVTYGTGAGYGFEPHQYACGTGIAFSTSPKRAIQIAREHADIQCGELSAAIPIHDGWALFKGSKLIGCGGDGLWFTESV